MEQEVLAGLVQRGMPLPVAQGVVANMIAESRLNPGINEIAPVVPGSRGGFGLNQWTGPRRRQYEAFAQSRGSALDDLDTQLDFTMWELQNTEKAAGQALMQAQDPETAARIYSEKFLRPGVPHLENRLAEARRLSGVQPGNALASAAPTGKPVVQNALAEPEPPQWQSAALDPRAFMTQRNALAFQPLTYDRRT